MLKIDLIGNLGADAEVKDVNGSKFITMRIAHTDKWKTESGEEKESTTWVDVTYNNVESGIFNYLKSGAKVYVRGHGRTRVYSSQKDRCMKAGLSIAATEIELVGGQIEAVPRQLIEPNTGALVDVHKFYCAQIDTSKFKKDDIGYLVDSKGNQYDLVKGGWVAPHQDPQPADDAGEEKKEQA
jgi:single-strand DNA-binding protein